jgi:hypothetical protein
MHRGDDYGDGCGGSNGGACARWALAAVVQLMISVTSSCAAICDIIDTERVSICEGSCVYDSRCPPPLPPSSTRPPFFRSSKRAPPPPPPPQQQQQQQQQQQLDFFFHLFAFGI